MRKTVPFCVAVASLFALSLPGRVSAAGVIIRDHENFTDSFDDNFCPGTATFFWDGANLGTSPLNDACQASFTFTLPVT